MNQLKNYGTNETNLAEAALYPDLYLARVTSQYNGLYKIVTERSELLAEISGKLRYGTAHLSSYPVVGDFVMVDRDNGASGTAIIRRVLKRKSAFERTSIGGDRQAQIIAANIDIVFICMSLNNDFNLSRLERYLSTAWSSGALPSVVLTKSDLCDDLPAVLATVASAAPGADIFITSNHDPISYEKIRFYIKPGMTASFVGSSGVGKSTLINRLTGQEQLATSSIRDDDKGRHTTTRRELIVLPHGGIVIDTPGMRELGVESVDLSKAFADIDTLAAKCRFGNCSHTVEPGCAVQAALESGILDRRRLESYQKLQKEAQYDGLSDKQIETEKLNRMFDEVGGMKNARKFMKLQNPKLSR